MYTINKNLNKVTISNNFNTYLQNLKFIGISTYKIKHNKNKYVFGIKDGIITFTLNIKDFKCSLCKKPQQCSLVKCKHIYYILIKILKLTPKELMFVGINNNIENIIIHKKIEIKNEDLECPICIDNVFQYNIPNWKRIHCLNCGKFYHRNCCLKLVNKTKGWNCINCYI